MAGVGRRGFAAVARAAMFALPPDRTMALQPHRKHSPPKYLDIDALSRRTSFCLIFSCQLLKRISSFPRIRFFIPITITNLADASV